MMVDVARERGEQRTLADLAGECELDVAALTNADAFRLTQHLVRELCP
jgi:hypothetical protein